MTICFSTQQLLGFSHRPATAYQGAFDDAQHIFERYHISKNRLRLAHFMAQVLEESCGLQIETENLNYRARRLTEVWPQRFQPVGPLDPELYAHNEKKLADEVYRDRMGNIAPDDGFTFRGRGLLQLTGRDSYSQVSRFLRLGDVNAPDFESEPEQVLSSKWCLAVAATIWEQKGCNTYADHDSLVLVTRAINGGTIGLRSRAAWLSLTKRCFQPPRTTLPGQG